ncbi:nuclear transport factor 2 family protein [Paenibacillus caseinilyticus]|nr:nuclear transport factor 2 family protein [Paenibacillus mucilaginosus]
MINDKAKEIIESYIKAYNSFDTESMLKLLHQEVVFKNFANGELNSETKGINEFRELAEKSAQLFSSRCQTVTNYGYYEDRIEAWINYEAVLAHDLPNGLKVGDKLQLKGRSVFSISEDKLILIEDYS